MEKLQQILEVSLAEFTQPQLKALIDTQLKLLYKENPEVAVQLHRDLKSEGGYLTKPTCTQCLSSILLWRLTYV